MTAASSAPISDGAAALLIMSDASAHARRMKPLARILAYATHAQEPEWFTTAPVASIRNTLDKLDWRASDVELYEINEAFAVVTMAAIKELELDPGTGERQRWSLCAGTSRDASGARILTTLIDVLARRGESVALLHFGWVEVKQSRSPWRWRSGQRPADED